MPAAAVGTGGLSPARCGGATALFGGPSQAASTPTPPTAANCPTPRKKRRRLGRPQKLSATTLDTDSTRHLLGTFPGLAPSSRPDRPTRRRPRPVVPRAPTGA